MSDIFNGFAEGDIVKLKSSGPNMTITKLNDYINIKDEQVVNAECTWFDGNELKKGYFNLKSIIKQHDA